jgi:hypothetical protein
MRSLPSIDPSTMVPRTQTADDDPMATCLARGAGTFDLTDIGGETGDGQRADNTELVDDSAVSEIVRTVLSVRAAGATFRGDPLWVWRRSWRCP